jgi:hypothetical protein
MAETRTFDDYRNITFEEAWALSTKTSENLDRLDEQMKKTDKRINKIGKQIGGLNRRFGQLAEHLVAPGIARRFNELGYHFDAIAPGGHRIFGEDGKIKTEVDILLENADYIIAVEVKTTPAIKDIEHHKKQLEIMREHRNKHNDSRKILGAIAGAIFGAREKEAVLEAGMYVLEQSGDTMQIEAPPGNPCEW